MPPRRWPIRRCAPWLVSTSQEPVGNSPAEFDAQYKADIDRYAKVIEQAKIPKQE